MKAGIGRSKIVGNFIRQRREAANLSQKGLGLLFHPPVTTQFISNLERGVTPLPLNHVSTLTQALNIHEAEIMALLEQEYALKVGGRLGLLDSPTQNTSKSRPTPAIDSLPIEKEHLEFMRIIYSAYRQANDRQKKALAALCSSILGK